MPKRSRLQSQLRLRRLRDLRSHDVSALEPSLRPSSSRRPRVATSRLSTWLGLFTVLALLFIGVRLFVMPRLTLDTERIVRSQLIPQLEKQLGENVEIGRIESNYTNSVTLHNVVIGRNKSNPLGAVFQAKRVLVELNLIDVILRRADALQSLRRVVAFSPQLYVERNAGGKWNFSKWIKQQPNAPPLALNATLEVRDGRVFVRDETIRSRRGEALVADSRGVTLVVQGRGTQPYAFDALLRQTFVGSGRVEVRDLAARGEATGDGRWIASVFRVPAVPATLLADYAPTRFDVRAGGTLSLAGQVAWDASQPPAQQLLFSGTAGVKGGSLASSQLRLIRNRPPLSFDKLDGTVSFRNRTFQFRGARGRTLGTTVQVDGTIALQPVALVPQAFDLVVRTRDADIARLLQLANVQGVNLRAGRAQVTARVRGTAANPQIQAQVRLPNVTLQTPQIGNLQAASASGLVQMPQNLSTGTARFTLTQARGTAPDGATWNLPLLNGEAAFRRDARGLIQALQAALRAPSYNLAFNSSQTGTGQFSGRDLVTHLAFSATPGTVPTDVTDFSGELSADWESNAVRATSDRFGSVVGGRARGELRATGSLAAHQARARFALAGTELNAPRWGTGSAGGLRGALSWRRVDSRLPLEADVAFSRVQARAGAELISNLPQISSPRAWAALRNGVLRASGLRLFVASVDAAAPRSVWNGATTFDDLDANALRLTTLAPELGARVRELGLLDGRARFANIGGSSPVLDASVQVSRALVDDLRLTNIRGQIGLRNGVLNIRDARAESSAGPLEVSASYDVKRGTTAVGFNAPSIAIDARQLNPYLASTGLQLQGTARGRVRVSATAITNAPIRTDFELALPLTTIYDVRVASRDSLRIVNGNLRGSGVFERNTGGAWNFVGRVRLVADQAKLTSGARLTAATTPVQIGPLVMPGTLRGADVANLALDTQGQVQRIGGRIVPRATGQMRATTATLPLGTTATPLTRVSQLLLQGPEANFAVADGTVRVPRLHADLPQMRTVATARGAAPATLDAYFNWNRGAWNGQVLARDVDASRAQRVGDAVLEMVNRATPGRRLALSKDVAIRGTAFVRADVRSDANSRGPQLEVQARLYRGALAYAAAPTTRPRTTVATVAAQPLLIPIEQAQARVSVALSQPGIGVQNLTLWSRGGRLVASGVWGQDSSSPVAAPVDFDVQINDFRVRDLQAILRTSPTTSNPVDGLLSGTFRLTGSTNAPHGTGQAALRLARIGDLTVDEATALVRFDQSARGTRLALSEIVARGEDIALEGNALADTTRNEWGATLNIRRAPAQRLLRAAEVLLTSETRRPSKSSTDSPVWPVRGNVGAQVQVKGTFLNGRLNAISLASGNATISSDELRWRGRELGVLSASLEVDSQAFRLTDLTLERQLTAQEIASVKTVSAPVVRDENDDTNNPEVATLEAPSIGDDTDLEVSNANLKVAQVRAAGVWPRNGDDALSATVWVANERLSTLRGVLTEVQRTIDERSYDIPNLQLVLNRVKTLPNELEARVNTRTAVSGQPGNLTVAVDADIDNAQLGGQALPELETSLVFDDGAIKVNAFELKQTFVESDEQGEEQRVRETALRVSPGGTLIPGGDINLDVEVLRANLSQLAGWIPELRDVEGRPVLRGELSLFSFEVRGQTASPQVIGSIEARNLSYRNYTFDRLRLATFQINEGTFSVAPGGLTIVKGGFQSSAAYGSVPWNWDTENGPVGPLRNGPLDVHLPLQTRDFGALAGAFVPALTEVSADEFGGEITVSGTINRPRFAGQVGFRDAAFRADPAVGPFPFGIRRLNGSVRFVEGNRLLVEGLQGELASANAIRATATGNPPAAERNAAAAQRDARREQLGRPLPTLTGAFSVNGTVDLALDPTQLVNDLRLASNRYDLAVTLANGAIYSDEYSGLRDIALNATWKTGDGNPSRSQVVAWKLSAHGRDSLKRELGREARGDLSSVGEVQLAPDFATGADALLRSRFDGNLSLAALPIQVRNLGKGFLDGELLLDNGNAPRTRRAPIAPQLSQPRTAPAATPSRTPAPALVIALEDVAKSSSTKRTEPKPGAVSPTNPTTVETLVHARTGLKAKAVDDDPEESDVNAAFSTRVVTASPAARRSMAELIQSQGRNRPSVPSRGEAAGSPLDESVPEATPRRYLGGAPLRISGSLVLSQADVNGLPVGGEVAIAPTLLDAPFFDISLQIGRNVRFDTPTIRAELAGNVAVTGTPLEPRVQGVVSTRNGQIRFPTTNARLEEGEIAVDISRDRLTQRLRSRVNIDATARGQVGRYQITIVLRGPLDLGQEGNREPGTGVGSGQNLLVDVTSNPPLSKDEAFAQLTGTSVREAGGEANEAYARTVLSVLSAPLFSGIERSLAEAFGLNTLTLDYRLNEPLNIEIGKAFGDRVFVTYRRSLSGSSLAQPTETFRVDFRVKGGVQVGAQTDNRGRKQLTIERTMRF